MAVKAKSAETSAAETQAAERVLLRREFTLSSPIRDGDAVIRTVTVTEPLAHQMVDAGRKSVDAPNQRMSALLTHIAGLTPEQTKKLKARDLGRITAWVRELTEEALKADGLANAVPSAVEPDPFSVEPVAPPPMLTDAEIDALDESREFELLAPFEHDGRRYERVTAVEPTVETMETAGRFKTQDEITVALVAGVLGVTIPVVSRMAQRDVVRVDTWLAPFGQQMISPSAGGI